MPESSPDGSGAAGAPAAEHCPACGEPTAAADRFCEECGQPLDQLAATAPPGPAPPGTAPERSTSDTATDAAAGAGCRCPDGRPDADGYCDSCGTLISAGRRRDECRAPAAALVSDPGLIHARNEDAGVVATAAGLVFAVVCDGVSSAPQPDAASRAAVGAATDALRAHLRHPGPTAGDDHTGPALRAAVAAAATAVGGLAGPVPPGLGEGVPACTFVAAVLDPAGSLHVANVGDSRAYWLPDDGRPSQLTIDDSWATDAILAGADPALVWADRRAHALTGWLGADTGSVEPQVSSMRLPGPGLVVVCSDGLWNYLLDLAAFADRVRRAHREAGADPLGCARLLVDFARDCGGRDNITVAVLRHGPAPAAEEDQPARPVHARTEEGRRP
jgi:serine/threonine protein phosphatase PrpC